jgi:hypothetical protein
MKLDAPGWSRALFRLPSTSRDGDVGLDFEGSGGHWRSFPASRRSLATRPGSHHLEGDELLYLAPTVDEGGAARVAIPMRPAWWVGATSSILIGFGLVRLLWTVAPRTRWILALSACLLGTLLSTGSISHEPIVGDARRNLSMAINLVDFGTLSHLDQDAPAPTNYREPLPPIVAAMVIRAARPMRPVDLGTEGQLAFDSFASKFSHLPWIFIGLIGIWTLTWRLTRSHVAGLGAAYLSWVGFYTDPAHLDSLVTEIPAATLLTMTSLALTLAAQTRRLRWAVACGLMAGGLVLTKAVFFHVFLGSLALLSSLLFVLAIRRPSRPRPRTVLLVIAWTAGLLVAVAPWLVRNHHHFGRWSISQRGGVVLRIRSIKNQMTLEEWVGAFWVWGPSIYHDVVDGSPLGATRDDIRLGGRLERLSRLKECRDVNYLYRAIDERVRAIDRWRAAGHRAPEEAADAELQRQAIQSITGSPLRHLACTMPFTWRGIWSVNLRSAHAPPVEYSIRKKLQEVLSLVSWLSLVALSVSGMRRRDPASLAVTLPSLLMLAAYAFLTHNISRYSTPALPVMFSSLVIWVTQLARGPALNMPAVSDKP